jgi:hypothetical protein
MAGAHVFAVLSANPDEPRIAYLKPGVRVPKSILTGLRLSEPAVDPTEIFRFAASCEEHRCTHYDGTHCRLGERVARQLEPVVDTLPPCQIRATCRWFAEQGRAVCLRCPQIVTRLPSEDSLSRIAATSQTRPTKG